jgi:hypothetical protein
VNFSKQKGLSHCFSLPNFSKKASFPAFFSAFRVSRFFDRIVCFAKLFSEKIKIRERGRKSVVRRRMSPEKRCLPTVRATVGAGRGPAAVARIGGEGMGGVARRYSP